MIKRQPNAKNYFKNGFIDEWRMVKILDTERN